MIFCVKEFKKTIVCRSIRISIYKLSLRIILIEENMIFQEGNPSIRHKIANIDVSVN